VAVKTQFIDTDAFYFFTITCYNWINLFHLTDFYPCVFKWFDFISQSGKKLVGYVIMPNHMHVLVYIPESSEPINKMIGEGKRFMAYDMVRKLKELNMNKLDTFLQNSVKDFEKIRGKKHQIFIPNSDIKLCYSEKIIIQKLDYMHANPVKGKWNLASDITTYPYSSASFYELNIQGIYPICHFWDVR
jgi:REP element-mobilizing transposase RayT